MPNTPDSDSLYRADHFAPDFSPRGRLGLEMQTKIVSMFFLPFSGVLDVRQVGALVAHDS